VMVARTWRSDAPGDTTRAGSSRLGTDVILIRLPRCAPTLTRSPAICSNV